MLSWTISRAAAPASFRKSFLIGSKCSSLNTYKSNSYIIALTFLISLVKYGVLLNNHYFLGKLSQASQWSQKNQAF